MAETRTFNGVTAEIWERVKDIGRSQYGTVFDPPQGNSGTATTPTPVGTLVLGFEFDRQATQITYTVRTKPRFLPSGPLWSGLAQTITQCRNA